MRKITQEARDAFENGYTYKNSNTKVIRIEEENTTGLYLHDNLIAIKDHSGLRITLAGWNTNTTRERLNGLRGVKVSTKQGQAYLNGNAWNGEWITIN